MTNRTIICWKNNKNKDSFLQRSKSEFDWINNNLQDIIGQESNWILSKCLCRTCRHLAWLKKSRRSRQDQWIRQKALHPSSFHCCHLQDLFHVLVVSVLIVLCVLQCAPGWDLLCQRNSVEREPSIKGWHCCVPVERSLSTYFHSQLLSAWWVREP